MKKYLLIFVILSVWAMCFLNWFAWYSFVDKVNKQSIEYRSKVVYILYDIIYQIDKTNMLLWPFEVVRVIDWDTIEIDYFWEKEKIRFYAIDTPERWELYYEEATEFTKEYLLWNNIYIKRIDKDRGNFGRLLREVYIDWVNFWDLLQKKWLATDYNP